MNRKKLLLFALFTVAFSATVALLVLCFSRETFPNDAKDIVVTKVERVDFDTQIDSDLAWVSGEENSVAAVHSITVRDNDVDYTYHQETLVIGYNLGTGQMTEIYNLWDYGVGKGNGTNFFWSTNGNRIVTDAGGILELGAQLGHWVNFGENGHRTVEGISSDGKNLLMDIWSEGLYFVNLDTGKNWKFQMDPEVFSSPVNPPMALSPDGIWIAISTYDPDYHPKPVSTFDPHSIQSALTASPIPSSYDLDRHPNAIYILRADGKEARLIARYIDGRVDQVTFSPNGTKLVWVTARNGEQYIYIANLDGSGVHEIYSNESLPSEYNVAGNLLWSPDGTRIIFLGPHNNDFVYPFWILTLGKRD